MKYVYIIVLAILLCLLLFPLQWSLAEAPTIPPKPPLKEYAYAQVLKTWDEAQWEAFETIIQKESSWKVFGAHYPVSKLSSAWGLCGTLVKTHEVSVTFKTDPYEQVDWCIEYVKNRYGYPQKALDFHKHIGWF